MSKSDYAKIQFPADSVVGFESFTVLKFSQYFSNLKVLKLTNFETLTALKLSKLKIESIDGYSIKPTAPVIRDILLHKAIISIFSSRSPMSWQINRVSPSLKKS